MKKLLFLLLPFLLVLSTIRGQTITNTSAVPHTTGTPSGAPSTYGSWIRFDKTNKILYRWTGSAWTAGVGTGIGGIYSGSGTVPGTTTATVAGGLRFNTGSTGQLLFGDYGFAGSGGSLNIQSSGTVLSAGAYGFRAQADDLYTQMVSPGYTVRLEPTTAYTLIQSTATNGYKFWDVRSTPRGVEYSADYSATYNTRSLVDKGYVDAQVATAGDGNGIYDGSGSVPTGTVATSSGTGFALRTIALGGTTVFRLDTTYIFSTGGLGDFPGYASIVASPTLGGEGAFLNFLSGDSQVQIGAGTASAGSRITLGVDESFYRDNTISLFGIQYADDYSATIATNDRSIPDVGTVKAFVFGSSSAKGLTATSTLNFPSTAAGTSSDLTITVTDAADGDPVIPGYPNASTLANGSFSAWVSAADTVTIRFTNNSSGALDPASGTFRATVLKY